MAVKAGELKTFLQKEHRSPLPDLHSAIKIALRLTKLQADMRQGLGKDEEMCFPSRTNSKLSRHCLPGKGGAANRLFGTGLFS